MKKKTLLASLVLASAALSLAACGQSNPTSTPTSAPTSTPTSAPTSTPTSTPTSAPTSTLTSAPTSAPEKNTVTVKLHYNPGDSSYDDEVILNLDQEDPLFGTKYASLDIEPKDDYKTFVGWFEDAEFTIPLSDMITEDTEAYAQWEVKKKNVIFSFLPGDYSTGGLEKDLTRQIFTICEKTNIRSRPKTYTGEDGTKKDFTKSIQMSGENAKFIVNVPADGNIIFYAQDGSSGGQSKLNVTKYKVDADLNNLEEDDELLTEKIGYSADEGKSAVNIITYKVSEGIYVFTSSKGTIDIFEMSFACEVDMAPIKGLDFSNTGVVDYLEGYSFDNQIVPKIVYENRTEDEIKINAQGISVDISSVDFTAPGVYDVKVSYDVTEIIYNKPKTSKFTNTIKVTVYALDSLILGFNAVSKGSNTVLGGNGTYVNNTVKVVYGAGEAYSNAYLSVFAKGVFEENSKQFNILVKDCSFDDATSFTGSEVKRTITVTYTSNGKTKTVSYDVYVVTTAPNVVDNVVQVAVDQKYTGTIGDVVDGFNTFTSIQQALDYLEAYSTAIEGKAITLKIGEGTYKEKLEFTLPNMTVIGAGKDKTIIEWNSLYGLTDESGFTHQTDSTQTVAVRESAENFTISGLTISNYWNDRTKYIESGIYGATSSKNASEHRALAILIQSDKFIMDDCKVLGMQDTIELFAGRQLIKNTYICGTTDFIFGTNNTTLFQGCTIEVKASEDNKSGGYITAFKGCSKDKDDAVTIGVIFNECTFKAEAGVPDESVAIARPWDIYSAVVVMNSELGKCIAKGTTVNTQKNKYENVDTTVVTTPVAGITYYVADGNNYVVANVTEWAADTVYYTKTATASRYYNGLTSKAFNLDANHKPTVKFFEYNNTGAGAMTDEELAEIVATYNNGTEDVSVRLVQSLDNELAEMFTDQKLIFAKESHPNIKYQDNWSGDIATDVTVNFYVADKLYTTVNECSGNTLILPDDPTVEGYLFEGWYVDNLYQTKYNLDSVLEAGTLNLYANFIVATSQTDTFSLDLSAITATSDKEKLTATTLGAANNFLSIVDSSKVTARVKDGAIYCIENKDGNLKVTFKGTGTITISYCSTNDTNNSRIRLVDEDGKYVTATTVDSAFTYVEAENAYEITGSTAKDITFTITSAGTYTIDCVSTTTGRGGRIYAVSMSDTYSVAGGSGDAGVMPLSLLKKEDEE